MLSFVQSFLVCLFFNFYNIYDYLYNIYGFITFEHKLI